LLERVVVIYGVSKAYAMTGWRIGLALAPGPIAKAMAALQSHTTRARIIPPSSPPPPPWETTRSNGTSRGWWPSSANGRDVVVARFRQELPGVEFVEPLGAFYFFFRVDSSERSPGRSSAPGS